MKTIYDDWQVFSPKNTIAKKQFLDENGLSCDASFFSGNQNEAIEEAKKRAHKYCLLNGLNKIRIYCGSKKALYLSAFDEYFNQESRNNGI